ncbi:hypothetical protein [Dorea sp. D27]|uniref:hypothetical protein n=1 Tax=Dorea sp. D27 TaxID=658665 RepID=UPI0006736A44|nr:hypothetical protein [Dorea sp. D27]
MYTYEEKKRPRTKVKTFPSHPPVIQGKLAGGLTHLKGEDLLAELEEDYTYPPGNRELYLSIIKVCISAPNKEYTELRQIADVLHLTPVYDSKELESIIKPLYENERLPGRTDIVGTILEHYSKRFSLKSIDRLMALSEFSIGLQKIIHNNLFLYYERTTERMKDALAGAQAAYEQADEAYHKHTVEKVPTKEPSSTSSVSSLAPPLPPPMGDSRLVELGNVKNRARLQIRTLEKSIQDITAENQLLRRIFAFSPFRQKTEIPPALNIGAFTVRHYTTVEKPTFTSIRSALSLGVAEAGSMKKSSGHTTDRDWNTFGNIGNTFFLLFVGGHPVCKQPFLYGTKHYVEFPLRQFAKVWVSSDWLDTRAVKGDSFFGTGREIHRQLLAVVKHYLDQWKAVSPSAPDFLQLTPAGFAEILGSLYNNFEVKVPGCVPIGQNKWIPSDFRR